MSALGAAMEAGDVEGVKTLLLALAEPERRKLAKEAAAAQKRFDAGSSVEIAKGTWRVQREGSDRQREAAVFAVLGTCSASELRETSQRYGVLWTVSGFWRELKPSFLPQAAELVTEGGSNWKLARALVREGLSARPTTDGYIRAFLEWHGRGRLRDATPLAEAIAADPALLDYEIWRLFEVEGGGEHSLAAHDKYGRRTTPWADAFLALIASGHLPRERVLDATLAALERDFSQFRASWFSQLQETLAPSVEERRARIAAYLRLLGSPIPPTVSFAMNALELVDAATPLSSEQVLPHATRLLAAGKKGPALALIALLGKMARREPASASAIARALLLTLTHESSDVQKRALDLLDRTRPALDAGLVAEVGAHAAAVAPSLRKRLAAWHADSAPEPAALAAMHESPVAKAAGTVDPIEPPVASLDELVDLAARALEDTGDPWRNERVLDGVSRLCDQRPADFALRAAPLVKRAKAILRRDGQSLAHAFARLVVAWVERRKETAPAAGKAPTLEGLLVARLSELATRVSRGEARPLLSFPAERSGVLDAEQLLARLAAWTGRRLDPYDVTLALLRLRSEARTAAMRKKLRALDDFRREEPRLETSFEVTTRRDSEGRHAFHDLIVTVVRSAPRSAVRPDPPAILAAHGSHREGVAGWEKNAIRWAATLMPLSAELFFADGARRLGNNLDWWEANWGTAAYLEPLREPYTVMGPMATLLLALGLSAKEPGEHALATDAAIASFEQGRLDGPTLGATFAQLHLTGLLTTKRWTRTLGVVAQASPVCSREVRRALQATLRGDPARAPRDEGALVDLLCELLAESGGVVDDPQARAYLAASRHHRRLKGDVLGRR